MGLGRVFSAVFGGGGSTSAPTMAQVDNTPTDPNAEEQERLRQLGRAALLSNGPTGVLGNSNIGRNSLLTR